jgi:hypothetical protein
MSEKPTTDVGTLQRLKEKARTVEIEGRTFYVLESDLLLNEQQLAEYAEARDRSDGPVIVDGDSVGDGPSQLLGISRNGKMARWRPGKVLYYYVAHESFPDDDRYRTAVEAVRSATEDWMKVCGIDFAYLGEMDKDPEKRNERVVFSVRYVDAKGKFIAAAFFPGDPPERRVVLIDPSFYRPGLGFDQIGVLRHELGHVLGFRHEQIREQAPVACKDEPLWDTFPLTEEYDPRSVMHYLCGGMGNPKLEITELDRTGAVRLYGLPLSKFEMVD